MKTCVCACVCVRLCVCLCTAAIFKFYLALNFFFLTRGTFINISFQINNNLDIGIILMKPPLFDLAERLNKALEMTLPCLLFI